jgi:Fe-S-cluster containining protein
MSETARCTGHCCESFTMPQSPERIWQMYNDWQKYADGATFRFGGNDIHIVAPMLIFIRETKTDPLDGREFFQGPQYVYTCKHFDRLARNCTIYENRPQMCRDYPYKSSCRYLGCTMKRTEDESPFASQLIPEKALLSKPKSMLDVEVKGDSAYGYQVYATNKFDERKDEMAEGPAMKMEESSPAEVIAPAALDKLMEQMEQSLLTEMPSHMSNTLVGFPKPEKPYIPPYMPGWTVKK